MKKKLKLILALFISQTRTISRFFSDLRRYIVENMQKKKKYFCVKNHRNKEKRHFQILCMKFL